MNNFGVIELASAKTTSAPGWAYVPDTTIGSSAALQPANRKRARNQPNLTASDLTARQEAKIRKELEILDKDGGRDASIPIPPKTGGSRSNSHLLMLNEIYLVEARVMNTNTVNFRSREAYPECPENLAVAKDLLQPPRRLLGLTGISR
jgi:hypothetical protein